MFGSATSRLKNCPRSALHTTALQNIPVIILFQMMQTGSTRPERIPSTLAGLKELNSKTLQELQQQLQAHLTAAHQELRAQVLPVLAGWLGAGCEGGGTVREMSGAIGVGPHCDAFCRTSSNCYPT